MLLAFSDPQAPWPDININGNVIRKYTRFFLDLLAGINGSKKQEYFVTSHQIAGQNLSTVVRPAFTYGSKCWTRYDKFSRDLRKAEMKMCPISLAVTKLKTKLDHSKSEYIGGTSHIKKPRQTEK